MHRSNAVHADDVRALRLKSWQLIHEVSGFVVQQRLQQMQQLLSKYSPTQPRVPGGNPAGGQWTSGGAGLSGPPVLPQMPNSSGTWSDEFPQQAPSTGIFEELKPVNNGAGILNLTQDEQNRYPDSIEPVYPLEEILAGIYAGPALSAIRELEGIWALGGSALEEIGASDAASAIEEYLGGEGNVITNPAGDSVIMRGDKKVRFDIKNPGENDEGLPDDPHFHIEQQRPNGKWKDAGTEHRYYFKKGKMR